MRSKRPNHSPEFMTTTALETARVKKRILRTGQNLKVSLVIFVSLFFLWGVAAENSFGQEADWEAEFTAELLKALKEGTMKEQEAKASEESGEIARKKEIVNLEKLGILEKDASILVDYRLAPEGTLPSLVNLIQGRGWSCDSISSAYGPGLFKPKMFVVECNRSRYKYEFIDRGGKWMVCVDQCGF